jgi:hypothetical protein
MRYASMKMRERERMKTRVEQAKTSGITPIEVFGSVVALLIVSASIRIVSNGSQHSKTGNAPSNSTNAVVRDLHSGTDAIHTYDWPN